MKRYVRVRYGFDITKKDLKKSTDINFTLMQIDHLLLYVGSSSFEAREGREDDYDKIYKKLEKAQDKLIKKIKKEKVK